MTCWFQISLSGHCWIKALPNWSQWKKRALFWGCAWNMMSSSSRLGGQRL